MKANKKNWFYDDKDFLHTWSKMKESRFYLLCSFLVNLLCVHFSMLYLLKTWSSQKRNPEITLLCWLVWFLWLHPVKQGELWFSSIPEEGGVDFKHFVTLGVLGMQRSIVLVNLLIFLLAYSYHDCGHQKQETCTLSIRVLSSLFILLLV